MHIDTDMNLYGSAAAEFFGMLASADVESIRLRDQFVAGIETEVNENGALVIECPELDIELGNDIGETDGYTSYVVKKKYGNCYVDHINVDNRVSCDAADRFSVSMESKIKKEKLYETNDMYAIRHETGIKYAA